MTPSPPAGFAPLASLSPQAGEGGKSPSPHRGEGFRERGRKYRVTTSMALPPGTLSPGPSPHRGRWTKGARERGRKSPVDFLMP